MSTEKVKQAIADAQSMVRSSDGKGALARLETAVAEFPEDLDLRLNLAMVHRLLGDLKASMVSLNSALTIDPYSFMAHLSKGLVLEQMGAERSAADSYRNALKMAPPAGQRPQGLEAPIARAEEVVEAQSIALAEYLHQELGPLRKQHDHENLARFNECVEVVSGRTRVYNAEPVQIHYPRLPAIPFFDRSYFPWFETLEAATDVIRDELQSLLAEGLPGFSPYVAYAPGTPENQFAPLNHSDRWSSLWLWKDGQAQAEAQARCPRTTAVLDELPLCDQPDFAPTALFSALAPHTRIPPHTGSTNTRLLVHLPLVIPGPAGFRVGNETREWRVGEAWAFDDTIEHEAWNDADETRIIMIFDIWNPLLSEGEKDLVRSLLLKHRDWLQEG